MTNQGNLLISIVIPVFRDGGRARTVAEAMLAQILPDGIRCEVIVVDDGSDDDTAMRLSTCTDPRVRILHLPCNQGRSAARNAGAAHSNGEFLVFIDCDCMPTNTGFLAAHLQLLQDTCIATCGPVTGEGHGFWSRYQSEASHRRAHQHAQGLGFVGSTQNFAVRNEAFRQVNGFDTRYKEYGFEDRDLFVRLSRVGTFGWCAGALVTHLDTLTLPVVLDKMRQAAGNSAVLFSHEHPEAYRALGFASIDARIHPWLRFLALTLAPFLYVAPCLDMALSRRWLPFIAGKTAVKLLAALAFARGSMEKPVHLQ